MKLETAVRKLLTEFGQGAESVPQVTTILSRCGAPKEVPDRVLDKLLKAGRALRQLGIK